MERSNLIERINKYELDINKQKEKGRREIMQEVYNNAKERIDGTFEFLVNEGDLEKIVEFMDDINELGDKYQKRKEISKEGKVPDAERFQDKFAYNLYEDFRNQGNSHREISELVIEEHKEFDKTMIESILKKYSTKFKNKTNNNRRKIEEGDLNLPEEILKKIKVGEYSPEDYIKDVLNGEVPQKELSKAYIFYGRGNKFGNLVTTAKKRTRKDAKKRKAENENTNKGHTDIYISKKGTTHTDREEYVRANKD